MRRRRVDATATGQLRDESGQLVPGRLILFNAPTKPPRGLQLGLDTTRILMQLSRRLGPVRPATLRHATSSNTSPTIDPGRAIMTEREARNFPEVARMFRMIDDDGQATLVVPYGDAARADRVLPLRKRPARPSCLQPFTVNVRSGNPSDARRRRACRDDPRPGQVAVPHAQQYDALRAEDRRIAPKDPADLIAG